ncbi:DUF1643 domain-containing protein [Paenibacillus dokdonensis]|uniref:DUF1643 domain-containing protein n=1 Tax=Paenibacillus dokdonensis TaxID=2567944 RepID=A0ABU6GWR2_9BACL|nr:DUF1643 domain-containing protein [Paenibacillus dokdonensis]MEC0244158.1 DUF1643 domain-containing protein [Paenibacillus dokdonensis]
MAKYKARYVKGKPVCKRDEVVQTKDKKIEKREVLKIELNKPGNKTVSVIMMNPSEADSDKSDGTVNKVIEFFINQPYIPLNERDSEITDIKHLNILNLLPIYNPKSKGINNDLDILVNELTKEQLQALFESNINSAIKTLKASDYIVLAWGMPDEFPLPLYYKLAAKVLEELIDSPKEIFVFNVRNSRAEYHLTKRLNPPHPSYCNLLGLVRVDIDACLRIIPRIPIEDEV